jgi:hypothetical protein
VFVPGTLFKPSLLVKHFLGAAFQGMLLTSLNNIRPGWKGFAVTNTLAYWVRLSVAKKIKCCEHGPKTFELCEISICTRRSEKKVFDAN